MGFATALTVASTGMAYMGQRQAGKQQEAAAKYNARMQARQANKERDARKENMSRLQDDRSRNMASVRVHQAASGVRVDTGSPLAVLNEIDSRFRERIEEYGNQSLARESYMRSQAEMTEYNGAQANSAARAGSIGTILGGIGRAGGQYTRGVKAGVYKDTLGIYNNH